MSEQLYRRPPARTARADSRDRCTTGSPPDAAVRSLLGLKQSSSCPARRASRAVLNGAGLGVISLKAEAAMPGGRKKLWRLFEEVEGDCTKVKCLVGGCPAVISRGPTGTARSKLNSSGMTNHAKAKHPDDYNEVRTETLIS